ncbi:MAG: Asp23/Gls24 family envelope stress response protein [Anaerolineae bacterium]|nr:Asp23/Gls24 family envelope stress response protein [Anaerolineae bacterium]
MDKGNNPLGNIYISHRAIDTSAYQSALEYYGVVGLAAKNIAEGLVQAIVKDPTLGVEVQFSGNKLLINLYIIVEYGTRIASVATSVSENVKFRVENVTGLDVDRVNVNVRGLRISNPD